MRKPRKPVDREPRGPMKLYRSYVFKNKDPVIDELRTIIQNEYGRTDYKAYAQIERDGGPTTTCMRNWFQGDTKRPQSASIEAAGRALGFRRVWVKNNGKPSGNGGR